MFKLFRNQNLLNNFKVAAVNGRSTATRNYSDETPRMERTINSVQLLGRVGVEPQKRGSEAHPVVTFTMATHSNYKIESGDWVQRVEWHKIAVFKPSLRESVTNYLSKGQRVMIHGKLSYGEVKDRQGVVQPYTTIIAEDIIFFQ